ncbi:MAG: hypothetical protein ABW065_11055 [Solirubrobacterales bacterium]
MGFFEKVKGLVRLAPQTEDSRPELGDLIEPGSSAEVSAASAGKGSDSGAAGPRQLEELRASGLIDADTFNLIEATMTNATTELDRLHASGVMSDEIYAQAMASMAGATTGSGLSIDAAEMDLLQHGESAPATILALPGPTDEANARLPITLEVHPATGTPYRVDCTIPTLHPGGELKVGNFLPIKIDPDDPKQVAIDWAGFGS